MKSAFY